MMQMIIRRKRFLLIIIAVILIIYLLHTIFQINSLENTSKNHLLCEITPETRVKMSQTLRHVIEAFSTLDITYFLCYNSLWGALQVKGPLKWHQLIELCLLNEEVAHLEEAFIIRTFKRKGLSISYQTSDGVYLVSQLNDNKPLVKLYLFEENPYNNHMRRVGWKNRLVPPDNCDQVHCFPKILISKPLPTEMFMNFEVPVPREQIEIQKYLFPDDWWKDTKPERCRNDA